MLAHIRLLFTSLLLTTDLNFPISRQLLPLEQWTGFQASLDLGVALVYYSMAALLVLNIHPRWSTHFEVGVFTPDFENLSSHLQSSKRYIWIPASLMILWFWGDGTLHLWQAWTRLDSTHWLFLVWVLTTLLLSLYGVVQRYLGLTYPPLIKATESISAIWGSPQLQTPLTLRPVCRTSTKTIPLHHKDQKEPTSSHDCHHLIQLSIDQMRDPMLWINAAGEFVHANPSACRFLGYSDTELKSLSLHDISSDFPQSMWSFHWQTLQQCGSLKIETRYRTKTQQLLPVEMTVNHLYCPSGEEYQCILIRDISDYKQIEHALRQRQQELRSLVGNIPGAVYRCAFDTYRTMTFLSDGIEPIIHHSARDFIHNRYQSFSSLIHPGDHQAVTAQIQTALQTQQPYTLEYRLLRADGSWRWVYDQGQGIFNSQGKLLWLNGAIFDITENKHALEALQASEERLQLALSGTDQGLWDWDLSNNDIYLSPQWPMRLGYEVGEIDSQLKSWLKLVHPADRHRLIEGIQQHLSGQTSLCQVEHRMRSKSGQWHWILNRSKVVRHSRDGQPLRMIGTVQDVSDRKQAEARERSKTQQLEAALEQLKQTQTQLIQTEKLSGLGQMVAGLAHEINNPVTFISGNITFAHQYLEDLLHLIQLYQQQSSLSTPEIQDWVEEIELDFLMQDLPKLFTSMEAGANRIKGIIRSLRNFVRLDEAEMKPVDIHEGIDNTLLMLQHRLAQSSADIPIQVIKEYGSLPKVDCYAGQLNQVFLNLLNNAIDALFEFKSTVTSSDDAAMPTIWIRTAVIDSDWIEIQIIDNGLGVPEEHQQHLFEPFFTTKPVGQGTGLGLATSYQIIEKHGGQLTCESILGQGAKFVIHIPNTMGSPNSMG